MKTKMSYETLLEKLETIIDKVYSALDKKDWANVKPGDLLAFMVLAKDIIKDTKAQQDSSDLDSWFAAATKTPEPPPEEEPIAEEAGEPVDEPTST
jgi:hypothetical protein